MKIGILGGTFNPPHYGHIQLGKDFSKRLCLDKVLVIPNKVPTHKRVEFLPDREDRLNMCRIAFNDPIFEISTIEMDREKDSYTFFTLEQLEEVYPDSQFYLFIGSDMFLSFHKWYKHKEILQKCTLCVETRQDEITINTLRKYAFETLGVYIKDLTAKNVIISPVSPFEVSSTEIRENIKNEKSVYSFLPPAIIDYIESRGLYRE